MRPLRLEATAFGAFAEPVLIDFTELGPQRLFLIQGPTGAGKTTILDAIAFALYGESSGRGTDKGKQRSHHAPPELATEVALSFRHGGTQYRVHRAPVHERPRKSGAGTTRDPARATLWRVEEDGSRSLLADGTNEVRETLGPILRLDLDAFRTVALLPQGEFRDLLTAKSSDREAILERLFGTSIYARIQDALAAEARRVSETVKGLLTRERTLLDQAGVAAATELHSRQAALAEAAEAAKSQCILRETEAHAALAQRDQARADAGLLAALASAQAQARQEAQARATDQAALLRAEQALAQANLSGPEREALRLEIEALKPIAASAATLAQTEHALARAEAAFADAETRRVRRHAEEVASLEGRDRAEALLRTTEASAVRLAEAELRLAACRRALQDRTALDQARSALAEAQALADRATATAHAAREAAISLDARARAGLAARLAVTLAEGAPCPVCGSDHHPAPARAEPDAPDDAAVETANHRASQALLLSYQAGATRDAAIARLNERELALGSNPPEPAELRARLEAATVAHRSAQAAAGSLEELGRRVAKARELADSSGNNRKAAEAAVSVAIQARDRARTVVLMRRDVVPEPFRAEGAAQAALTKAGSRLGQLDEAAEAARTVLEAARRQLAGSTGRAAQAEEAARRAAEAAQGLTPPDLAAAEARLASAQGVMKAATEAASAARERLQGLERLAGDIADTASRRSAAEAESQVAADLAATACGTRTGSARLSFSRFVLARLFDQVLLAANQRLGTMSGGRYALGRGLGGLDGRSTTGLDIEVADRWTGASRSAGTLSGGEGFLAALALALGVVDTVQAMAGGAPIETLFVDEGFGSLDPEALEQAMTALVQLQVDGRLVGLISHVEGLRERIPAQLEVVKGVSGSRVRWRLP